MAKHIGIVACSAEGAALCYQTLCREAPAYMGEHMHPQISMHTHPLGEYMEHIYRHNWEGVVELMVSSSRKLAACGADFAICPDNTIHQVFDKVADRSPIPWLHIVQGVATVAKIRGFRKLGITGTKYLMEGPVYPEKLEELGMQWSIPDGPDREKINDIIFKELVNGIFKEKSRLYFNDVIKKLKADGCDAVVLGCTEIPLLVDPDDCPLPVLDSTRLLARAALKQALEA